MRNYDSLKYKYSKRVCQTLNNPIMVFDVFELTDVMSALATIMFFGVVLYSFSLAMIGIVVTLGVIPAIKRRFPKGIIYHLPYRYGMSLPGLINPGSDPVYSD